MPEETMPVIEAPEGDVAEEPAHYECAFHILPTITDEEVSGVVDGLKSIITRAGGSITDEEVPRRYDLAYDITKPVDGSNRRFNAAHFGWVRFRLVPTALAGSVFEISHMPEILRHLVVRLMREESQMPVFVFETHRTHDQGDVEEVIHKADTDGAVDDEVVL